MSQLQSKLNLLKRTSGLGQAPKRPPRPAANEATDQRLCDTLQGRFQETPRGVIFSVQRSYPVEQSYGQVRLEQALELEPEVLGPLYESVKGVRLEDALFFDTETTGLAGGSGTYAFLVGIGYFRGDRFLTEQLLMRDHADEPALLEYLSARLHGRSGLVSFNGKSFDAQLLSTRFAMHRRATSLPELPHLDLVHVARRIWGGASLPDCRLETLEHRLLGAPRHQDVPGWMIPDMFFQFLRDRNPAPLKGVVEHNRRDLLAMVGLCGHLQSVLQPGGEECCHPEVRLRLGRLWACLGDSQRSDELLRSALTSRELDDESREKGLVFWAREMKRRKDWERASILWRRVLTRYPGNLEATVELAKWFEHRRKDFRTALILVEGGLRDRTLTSTRRERLEYRADRLRRRLDAL